MYSVDAYSVALQIASCLPLHADQLLPPSGARTNQSDSQATPIANKPPKASQPFHHAFFARPVELVAPSLIGSLLVKRQPKGDLLWGVIVETEAYG